MVKMSGAVRHKYRVTGFGQHVEFKVLEFLDEVKKPQVCSFCGVIDAKPWFLQVCKHTICTLCFSIKRTKKCPVDELPICAYQFYYVFPITVDTKKVRCPYAGSGCGFTGKLDDLNEHLNCTCDFYLLTCTKCEGAFVFKDMMKHYPYCEGRSDELVGPAAADARSLLKDFGDTRNKLERALNSTTDSFDELKAAVASIGEQFERLQSQLAVPGADAAAPGFPRPEK